MQKTREVKIGGFSFGYVISCQQSSQFTESIVSRKLSSLSQNTKQQMARWCLLCHCTLWTHLPRSPGAQDVTLARRHCVPRMTGRDLLSHPLNPLAFHFRLLKLNTVVITWYLGQIKSLWARYCVFNLAGKFKSIVYLNFQFSLRLTSQFRNKNGKSVLLNTSKISPYFHHVP